MTSRRPNACLSCWGAMFVLVVDTSLMNVSIAAVVNDPGTTVSGVQGAISLEALVSAAFILIGSKVGDLIGRKRAYMAAYSSLWRAWFSATTLCVFVRTVSTLSARSVLADIGRSAGLAAPAQITTDDRTGSLVVRLRRTVRARHTTDARGLRAIYLEGRLSCVTCPRCAYARSSA